MKLNVFYSWQSDLPKGTTSSAIRTCIKKAIPEIEGKFEDLVISLTEATSNDPGTPDIAERILHKIDECDVFIADITTINNSETTKRKTPNPNVLIELGYAISRVGWKRIILLFNEEYGSIDAKEVPFDIDRKRIAKYRVTDKSDTSGISQLKATLCLGIETILKTNPPKQEIDSLGKIKRQRDIENLESIFSQIHLPTLDYHLQRVPHWIQSNSIIFLESLEEVIESSTFHLYDKEALRLVTKFCFSLRDTLSYPDLYTETSTPHLYKLSSNGRRRDKAEMEIIRELTNAAKICPKDMRELVLYVRENYAEIDLNAHSEIAWNRYKGN